MSNEIPTKTRKVVKERWLHRCARCSGPGAEIQHRVRRREGGHRFSNLCLMCHTCHQTWAHAHPDEARRTGFIVPTWADPSTVPLKAWIGWVQLDDEGGYVHVEPHAAEERIRELYGDL